MSNSQCTKNTHDLVSSSGTHAYDTLIRPLKRLVHPLKPRQYRYEFLVEVDVDGENFSDTLRLGLSPFIFTVSDMASRVLGDKCVVCGDSADFAIKDTQDALETQRYYMLPEFPPIDSCLCTEHAKLLKHKPPSAPPHVLPFESRKLRAPDGEPIGCILVNSGAAFLLRRDVGPLAGTSIIVEPHCVPILSPPSSSLIAEYRDKVVQQSLKRQRDSEQLAHTASPDVAAAAKRPRYTAYAGDSRPHAATQTSPARFPPPQHTSVRSYASFSGFNATNARVVSEIPSSPSSPPSPASADTSVLISPLKQAVLQSPPPHRYPPGAYQVYVLPSGNVLTVPLRTQPSESQLFSMERQLHGYGDKTHVKKRTSDANENAQPREQQGDSQAPADTAPSRAPGPDYGYAPTPTASPALQPRRSRWLESLFTATRDRTARHVSLHGMQLDGDSPRQ
jgi:hypothetical protein